MDFSPIKLMGLELEHPIMNAAGTCRLVEEVEKICRSAASAIMVGSITVELRDGNSGNVYWNNKISSLNSMGLPGQGKPYYEKNLGTMVSMAHDNGKPLIVSVAGFSPEEYAKLAVMAFKCRADAVELNLGCPNIWGDRQQKRIACFDSYFVADILQRVEDEVGTDARVSVKLSPFSDPFALREIATKFIAQHEVVKGVVSINTFPNAFVWGEDGKPAITPGEGLAGLGGPAVKCIGLGQVKQLKDILPERIQVIGVGGISNGQDILDYIKAGATAVQVATAYVQEGEQVFSRLLQEMVDCRWEKITG